MIVAIYGSPRKNANTDILTDTFLSALEAKDRIKRFWLRNMRLRPCIGCHQCNDTGICIYKDDIWDIYESIEKAKGVILASPIYFASVTAQMKTFIDRGQAFWVRKYILHQTIPTVRTKGFYISSAAMNTDKAFIGSLPVIKSFMISLNIEYSGELLVPGVEKTGEVRSLPEVLDFAYQAGKIFFESIY